MKLNDIIDKSREPYFICIGTPNSILDSVAPRVGTLLLGLHYNVIGTLLEPLHGMNLKDRYENKIKNIDKKRYQVIAIDSCIDDTTSKKKILIENSPVRPGKGVGKNLPDIGEISIKANVCYEYDSHDLLLFDLITGIGNEEFVEELVRTILVEISEAYPISKESPTNTFQAFG